MYLENEQFEQLVAEAWAEIPSEFKAQMENLAVLIEPEASPVQLRRLRVKGLLLGLFEGVPKTAWGQATMGVQPDKITVFQEPILEISTDLADLKKTIKIVLMHEIAHYFGYSDDDMFIMDKKLRQRLENKSP